MHSEPKFGITISYLRFSSSNKNVIYKFFSVLFYALICLSPEVGYSSSTTLLFIVWIIATITFIYLHSMPVCNKGNYIKDSLLISFRWTSWGNSSSTTPNKCAMAFLLLLPTWTPLGPLRWPKLSVRVFQSHRITSLWISDKIKNNPRQSLRFRTLIF